VGDTVSIAEELEALTKKYGVRLLFSGEVSAALADMECVCLDTIDINGREISLYTPGNNS